MKKFLSVILILLAGSVFVFAGSRGNKAAGDAVRWAYWGSEGRVKISQEAIDIFEAQTGIQVNPEPSGGAGDHFVKVDTQLAGGNGPDIIQMGGNINDYVSKGVLLPLETYAGTLLDTSVIDASAIESGTLNGHLYGISTGVTMPALVYNQSMLQRAGVKVEKLSMTYPEFEAFLKELKAELPAGVYPMQDIGSLSSNSTGFGYWLSSVGTLLYDDKTNSTEVTPRIAAQFLELYKGYRDQGLVPPADIAAGFAENNADSSALVAGKAAIGFIWTNQLAGYQAAMTDELSLMEFPGAAKEKALWQAPSQFYTVNKESRRIEDTVKFINFLVNSPDAAEVLGNDRGASASASARSAALDNPADRKVIDYLKVAGPHTSKETAHLPNDTEFNSTLYLIYQQVAFGRISTAEGGQQIYDLIVRLINK